MIYMDECKTDECKTDGCETTWVPNPDPLFRPKYCRECSKERQRERTKICYIKKTKDPDVDIRAHMSRFTKADMREREKTRADRKRRAEERRKDVERLRRQGLSCRAIGEELGLHPKWVQVICIKLKLSWIWDQGPRYEERINRIECLRRQGLTYKEIAAEMDLSFYHVQGVCRKLGLTRGRRRGGPAGDELKETK